MNVLGEEVAIDMAKVSWMKRLLGFVLLASVAAILAWQVEGWIAGDSVRTLGQTALIPVDQYSNVLAVLFLSLTLNLAFGLLWVVNRFR